MGHVEFTDPMDKGQRASISQSQFMTVIKYQVDFVEQIQKLLMQGSARLSSHGELPSASGGLTHHSSHQMASHQMQAAQQQQQMQTQPHQHVPSG